MTGTVETDSNQQPGRRLRPVRDRYGHDRKAGESERSPIESQPGRRLRPVGDRHGSNRHPQSRRSHTPAGD
ncbi:hypothetical protein GCM10010295_38060 [Streptomyces intermedius]